ncbi:hypothetical protein [Sodalis-like endosymbiont of Proechinophthirus fluctus]|uniref:hypothetical protein n=1 Tax=Sodalis-like endosymbiont of Proechinophthirus fluctus TaxID=1462730 RepID=UPI0016505F63|nr:hypothetical protein [Sodalis-like endosymbiont of Proechinophthirus fluctus]
MALDSGNIAGIGHTFCLVHHKEGSTAAREWIARVAAESCWTLAFFTCRTYR